MLCIRIVPGVVNALYIVSATSNFVNSIHTTRLAFKNSAFVTFLRSNNHITGLHLETEAKLNPPYLYVQYYCIAYRLAVTPVGETAQIDEM